MTPQTFFRSQHARNVLIILLLSALVVCAWWEPLDAAAELQVDQGFNRALVSFAAARALNAIISVAQGTQVSVQIGVGVNLSVGQVLEPINHVIEQFSFLMLAASVSFGVQKMLLKMGAHWVVAGVLTVTALAWAVLRGRGRPSQVWLNRALVILLTVRFALPVVTVGSDFLFRHFLATKYATSQQVLNATTLQFDTAGGAATAPPKPGLIERLKRWAGGQQASWSERVESLRESIGQATEHIINLMVIFILQTLVLPVAMLWAIYGLTRAVLRRESGPKSF